MGAVAEAGVRVERPHTARSCAAPASTAVLVDYTKVVSVGQDLDGLTVPSAAVTRFAEPVFS